MRSIGIMSEKMFGTRVDDVDSSILNITRDGEDFAWFLSDIVTDKQVEKVVDKLNELSEEKEYFERKKEYFLSKWSIVNVKNIQLRQEIDDLKEENERLKKARDESDKFIVKKGLEIEFLEWCKEDE